MFFHFMSNIGSVLRVPRLSLAPSSEVARPDGFLLSRSGSMHSGMLWCTASQRALDCDGEWLGWAGWVRLGWAGVRMGGQAGRQAAVAKVLGQQIAVHAAAMGGGWGGWRGGEDETVGSAPSCSVSSATQGSWVSLYQQNRKKIEMEGNRYGHRLPSASIWVIGEEICPAQLSLALLQ